MCGSKSADFLREDFKIGEIYTRRWLFILLEGRKFELDNRTKSLFWILLK